MKIPRVVKIILITIAVIIGTFLFFVLAINLTAGNIISGLKEADIIDDSMLKIENPYGKDQYGAYKLVNHIYHFEVIFPSAEKPEKIGNKNIVGFQSYSGEGKYAVTFHSTNEKMTSEEAEDYLNSIAEAMIENRKNGRIVYKERIMFKNMKAVKYKLAFDLNSEPFHFYQTSISMVSRGKPYTITAMCPQKYADKVESTMQTFFSTFRPFNP